MSFLVCKYVLCRPECNAMGDIGRIEFWVPWMDEKNEDIYLVIMFSGIFWPFGRLVTFLGTGTLVRSKKTFQV